MRAISFSGRNVQPVYSPAQSQRERNSPMTVLAEKYLRVALTAIVLESGPE